jgi:hypothetical protein
MGSCCSDRDLCGSGRAAAVLEVDPGALSGSAGSEDRRTGRRLCCASISTGNLWIPAGTTQIAEYAGKYPAPVPLFQHLPVPCSASISRTPKPGRGLNAREGSCFIGHPSPATTAPLETPRFPRINIRSGCNRRCADSGRQTLGVSGDLVRAAILHKSTSGACETSSACDGSGGLANLP